jgi:hypothetical protein
LSEAALDVHAQISALLLFPDGTELLHCAKNKASLIVCELTVLPEGVKTDHIALLLGEERFCLDLGPLLFLGLPGLPILLLLLLDLLLFFLPLGTLLVLLVLELLDAGEVGNCSV